MAFPTITVRIAFATAPFATTPTWTDVSSEAMSFSFLKGRQHHLNRIEAATCLVTMNNASGDYWPNNTGGTHYPNVKPLKRINVRATYSAVTYDIFTGFIIDYIPSWKGQAGKAPVMTLDCVGLMRNIAKVELTTSESAELSGTRIGNVLDEVGWPAADRDLAAGQSIMQATGAQDNVNALEHIQLVAASELGLFFEKGNGDATFHDRMTRRESPYDTSQATFGDDAGEMKYRNVVFKYDEELIYNNIRLTRVGGTEQTANDATGVTDYGKRVLSRTDLLYNSDEDCDSIADYWLTLFKDAIMRVQSLTVDPRRDEANLYPKVLGYDLSTRITVRLNQASIDEEYHIEGIAHDVNAIDKSWVTTWQLGTTSIAVPTSEIIYPDADGYISEWTAKSAGDHYVEIDEVTADDTTSYLKQPHNLSVIRDAVTIEDGSGTGTVTKIVINYKFGTYYATDSYGEMRVSVRIDGTDYQLGNQYVENTAPNIWEWWAGTIESDTNPDTSATWTWSDVNALELVIHNQPSVPGDKYCTWLNVTVHYTI